MYSPEALDLEPREDDEACALTRLVVDRYHVGTSFEEIRDEFIGRVNRAVNERGTDINLEDASRFVRGALKRHADNRKLYGYVMGGMKQ